MDDKKRAELAAKGWVATSVEEFLGLTPQEVARIDQMIKAERERSVAKR